MPEWTKYRLGDVTVNFDARRVPVKSADRKPGPFPYYGASGVVDWVDNYTFDGEYLLIAEDGENLRTRKTPIAFVATGKFWVNNHAHIVQGNALANTRYLGYILAHADIAGFLSGSTQPKLTQAAMNAVCFSLPSRRHQDATVELIGALDDKIAVNERIATSSMALAEASFEGVLQGATSHSELGALIDLTYGKALREPDRRAGKVPVFGCTGQVGWHNAALSSAACAVVGRKGANAGHVSWSPAPCWVIDTAFYVRTVTSLTAEFAYFLLRRTNLRNLVGDSAIPGLNRGAALAHVVEIPGRDQIEQFTAQARPLLEVIADIEEQNRNLGALRDALLPGLMSGEIQVRDAEKVVDEAK